MVRPLYTLEGKYVAYIRGEAILSKNGDYLGYVFQGIVFDPTGAFVGVLEGNRITDNGLHKGSGVARNYPAGIPYDFSDIEPFDAEGEEAIFRLVPDGAPKTSS